MIVDDLQHLKNYAALHPAFATAAAFLENPPDLKLGRNEVDGDALFVIRADYNTKPLNSQVWEAHRAYGDIHVLLDGEERFGYAPIGTMRCSIDYDTDNDVELFTGTGDFITLRPNSFCIVGPNDVHMPGQAVEDRPMPVKKLVFKWKV